MVNADAMLVRNGGPVGYNRLAGGALHLMPAMAQGYGILDAWEKIRDIDAGAIRINMRKMGENEHRRVTCQLY